MSKHFDDSYTLINPDDEKTISVSRNKNFNGLEFIDFTLTNTDFSECSLVASTFVRTRLESCCFGGADLRCSNLNESEFIKCNVFNARLFDDVYATSVVSKLFDPKTGISGFHVFDTTSGGVVVSIHSSFYTVDQLLSHLYTLFGKPRADEYLSAIKKLAIDSYGESRWK